MSPPGAAPQRTRTARSSLSSSPARTRPRTGSASTLPFFARDEVAAVVTPQLSPSGGMPRARAAAVAESRLGSGSLNSASSPGASASPQTFPPARSSSAATASWRSTLRRRQSRSCSNSTREAGGRSTCRRRRSRSRPAPLFRAHLRESRATASRAEASCVRRRGSSRPGSRRIAAVALLAWARFGWLLVPAGYTDVVARGLGRSTWRPCSSRRSSAACGSVRRASGALAAPGLVLTHFTYSVTFVSGLVRRDARLSWDLREQRPRRGRDPDRGRHPA